MTKKAAMHPALYITTLDRSPLTAARLVDPPEEAPAKIESVVFKGSTIRSSAVAVATVTGQNLATHCVRCEPVTSGFIVDMLEERSQRGDQVILGIRVYRRPGTPSGLCLLRFAIGDSVAIASITVRR